MDNVGALLRFYVRGAWRRKWLAAAIAWVVCLVGWGVVYMLPGQYESHARVYIDIDGFLTPLLKGLAADTNAAAQLDYMRRTLLSRPNLLQVAHLADLDKDQMPATDQQMLLDRLARDITVTTQGPHLFSISYQNPNPVVARDVVQSLLTVFSESTAGNNQSDITTANRFLDQQIANYEQQLRAAERRRAKFNEDHADVLPDIGSIGTKRDAARNAVAQDRAALADAIEKENALQKELSTVPQFLNVDQAPAIVLGGGAAPTGPRKQLADSRQRLALLLSQYTEEYPDVVTLRRTIATLEKEVAEEGSHGEAGSTSRHATIPNNVYEQLRLKIVDMETTIAAMTLQLSNAEKEEARLAAVVKASPGIELQAENLDRDYSVMKKNYEALLARRESAHLAQAADVETDKGQFRIVDAPDVPLEPSAPNRPLLYSAILIVGLGSALALPIILLQLDRSFSTLAGLRTLGFPVIGGISAVDSLNIRKHVKAEVGGFAIAAMVLVVVYAVLLASSFGFRTGMV